MNATSLFSNIGIAETYFKEEKIDLRVGNELLKERAEYWQEMHPEPYMIQGDITDKKIYKSVLEHTLYHRCKFLIAGPPCQGMSKQNREKTPLDPRNLLILYALKLIKEADIEFAIIENVAEAFKTSILVGTEEINIKDLVARELSNYHLNFGIKNAMHFGVPQTRRRGFVLISKNEFWEFPKQSEKIMTIKEAIGHLPSLECGDTSDIPFHNATAKHQKHAIEVMKCCPTGKHAFDNPPEWLPKNADGSPATFWNAAWRRADWDKPSGTLTTKTGDICTRETHPGRLLSTGLYSDARAFTLKELFLLTSLPDSYTPPDWASDNLIRHGIGEGIPPRMIQAFLKTMPRKAKPNSKRKRVNFEDYKEQYSLF